MPAAPLLELRALAVEAGGRRLVDDLSLGVAAGEAVALSGPSGCGKSSLLRVVAGLDDPAAGAVMAGGSPAGTGGWPAYRRSVVLVQQTPVMLPGTVGDNLGRPFEYACSGEAFPVAQADDLLERLGFGRDRLPQPASTLSVGEKQRVALVRALLTAPDVLLLDEPTSALDPGSVAAVEEMLRERRAGGLAALVVTHDEGQAGRLADRSVVLDGAGGWQVASHGEGGRGR